MTAKRYKKCAMLADISDDRRMLQNPAYIQNIGMAFMIQTPYLVYNGCLTTSSSKEY